MTNPPRQGGVVDDQKAASGTDVFIVDNSDSDWKVLSYLREWAQFSQSVDIATGYFEIGSLLALDGEWQKVDYIRILMGDEVTLRTGRAFITARERVQRRVVDALQILDRSLEDEKEKNDFLKGVPAIVEAIRAGRIECRVYQHAKFHAKTYITHARSAVIGSFALVGSSNFTYPGLTQNVEMNVQITGSQVRLLQEWFERYWEDAVDATAEVLTVIERHVQEYLPFEVYAKSLQELFRNHEDSDREWEETHSGMYPVLDQYQKDGYHNIMQIARQYGGAFLCDGVGLGKTFVGLMVIERLVVKEGKNVLLLVPKTTNKDVWQRDIARYLPNLKGTDFNHLAILNHTDLSRTGGDIPNRLRHIADTADAILIDEAHHFRNPGLLAKKGRSPTRYRVLFDLVEGPKGAKELFMLTATPVNNQLDDVRHMMELFTRRQLNYFGPSLGIQNLISHFVQLEKSLASLIPNGDASIETNNAEAGLVLEDDTLFRTLVVQRSRDYVRRSQELQGVSKVMFPEREPPQVAPYSVKATYGKLLGMVEKAFSKKTPLFALATYYPMFYYRGEKGSDLLRLDNRQKQVVGLIRTMFLKRFESSVYAFESSCERLFVALLAWVEKNAETPPERHLLERWKNQHGDLIERLETDKRERKPDGYGDRDDEEDADDVTLISEQELEGIEKLPRDQYRVEDILSETYFDLEQLETFLQELYKFKPAHDDKLKALVKLLKTDDVLKSQKVLIFTEFADTARYLKRQLIAAGITGVAEIDGSSKDRGTIIGRFAPYYNDQSSAKLEAARQEEIRVLVSTDVLSEGLNLQDATRLINYDIHWNPVRLMQRIGRVDRRMNPEKEAELLADHPEQQPLRGHVAFWNFLPPDELDSLLNLYKLVAHKTLRISKTFGIEGKKLLKSEDDYDALREFNKEYEGTATPLEMLRLEMQKLLTDDPELASRLNGLPGRVFSGKEHPRAGTKAVFFCYRIARPDHTLAGEPWTDEAGETTWYLYDVEAKTVNEDPLVIAGIIRSSRETPRSCSIPQETLSDIRHEVEKHIKNTYLKRVQAPMDVKPVLTAWMELN